MKRYKVKEWVSLDHLHDRLHVMCMGELRSRKRVIKLIIKDENIAWDFEREVGVSKTWQPYKWIEHDGYRLPETYLTPSGIEIIPVFRY